MIETTLRVLSLIPVLTLSIAICVIYYQLQVAKSLKVRYTQKLLIQIRTFIFQLAVNGITFVGLTRIASLNTTGNIASSNLFITVVTFELLTFSIVLLVINIKTYIRMEALVNG